MTDIANAGSSRLHPVFAYGTGLDGQVWSFLHEQTPRTVNELAMLMDRSEAALRGRLRKLETAGLARRDDRSWLRVGDMTTLDRISNERGLTTRAVKRRERHLDERANHLRLPSQPQGTPT